MTVNELIAILRLCPPDMLVKFESSSGQIHELKSIVAADIFNKGRCIMLCDDDGYICGPQEVKHPSKPDKAGARNRYNQKKAVGLWAEHKFQKTLKLRAKLIPPSPTPEPAPPANPTS